MPAQHITKLSAPYFILSANSSLPTMMTIGSQTNDNSQLTVYGNLIVTGSHTSINTTNTTVTDNVLTLNAGESGAGVTLNTSGIIVDRGQLANVSILWNESNKMWELTNDGSNFFAVAYVPVGTHAMTKLEDDPNPTLGGNLNVNGHYIYSPSGTNVLISGGVYTELSTGLQIDYSAPPSSSVANAVVVNSNVPGQGQTGLYVTNALVSNQELVTTNRAIVYSIIF